MPLLEKIEQDFQAALRSQSKERMEALRLVKAALHNKKIDNKGKLDDAQILAVLKTLAKQRQEAIELYQKGGRPERVAQEKAELALIESYLPAPLSEAEVLRLVEAAIRETGASGANDVGKVMKALMPKLGGKADGKQVNELVRKKLA